MFSKMPNDEQGARGVTLFGGWRLLPNATWTQPAKSRLRPRLAAPQNSRKLSDIGLLPVLIDAQPPDLRFQRLPGNPEFRGCAGGSGYAPVTLGESRFDHLNFASFQRRKPFVRTRRIRRFAF